MRLRHLPTFRQTRRQPGLSGNDGFRLALNKLNPLKFDALFKGPEATVALARRARHPGGVARLLHRFVPCVGEKFP